MAQSVLNGTATIEEEATAVYTAQLQDEDGANLAKASISAATLRVVDVKTGTVIQADTSIIADIDTNGLLTTTLPASYFNFDDSSAKPRDIEERQIIIKVTYASGGKVDVHHLFVKVNRSRE